MASRYSWVSGSPILDVLNTVDWIRSPRRATDRIRDYADVIEWSAEAGTVTQREQAVLADLLAADPAGAAAALHRFCDARDTAYRALLDRSPDEITHLGRQLPEAFAVAVLRPTGDGWVWDDVEVTLATPVHRVLRGLAELMRDDRIAQLRRCGDDACGTVFLDTSPRRNRRWCVAAGCGDRNRSRAYYGRHRDSPSGR